MLWKNALENLILGTILFSPGGRTNPKLHDEFPPQGLSGAQRGNKIFLDPDSQIRRGGVPSGAAELS
jgi:hypothetical protein